MMYSNKILSLGKACMFMLFTSVLFTEVAAEATIDKNALTALTSIKNLTTIDSMVEGNAIKQGVKGLAESENQTIKQLFWSVFIYRALEKFATEYLTLTKNETDNTISGKLSGETKDVTVEAITKAFWATIPGLLTDFSVDSTDAGSIKIKYNTTTETCSFETGPGKDGETLNTTVKTVCTLLYNMHKFIKQVLVLAEDKAKSNDFVFIVTQLKLITVNDSKLTIKECLNQASAVIVSFIAAAVEIDFEKAVNSFAERKSVQTFTNTQMKAKAKASMELIKAKMQGTVDSISSIPACDISSLFAS